MSAPAVATAADVRRLYQELLAREPESAEAVQSKEGQSLLDLAIEFAKSPEYTRHALRLELREYVRVVKAVLGPSTPDQDWLAEFKEIVDWHKIGIAEVIDYLLRISGREEG